MRAPFLACTAFLILPTASISAPEDCAKLGEDTARLACYDDIFGVQTTSPTPTSSKWRKDITTNAMTDKTDVFMSLTSEDTVPGKYSGNGHGILYLRCMENTTAIQFGVADHFLADIQGYGKVEYRLDDQPMKSRNFTESTSNETLGLWRGSQAIPFIKAMLGHDRMIVRITPFNESPKLMEFQISGLAQDITELRATCGW